jgi:hypothetical protein
VPGFEKGAFPTEGMQVANEIDEMTVANYQSDEPSIFVLMCVCVFAPSYPPAT